MTPYTIEHLDITPCFDLELLMSTSQETRIGGAVMEQLSAAWDKWVPHAHALRITVGDQSYLAAYLGQIVEEEVDNKWEETPSDAFMFNALAQVMCMGLVHTALPEVEEMGCAPAPAPEATLAKALEEAGIPYAMPNEPGLSCRYGVVTWYPFKGGCERCALRNECPKATGAADGPSSVVLPGFE